MPSLVTAYLSPGHLAALDQPVLAAEGLTVRPWRAGDHPAVVAAFADPAIQRWHCRTLTDAEALGWIGDGSHRWGAETAASWAVTDGDEVAGQVGLRGVRLDEGRAAISYWVLPQARGRRVASRALSALTRWCFADLGLHRLELHHSTLNEASCRVAERAGYAAEGTKRAEALHADGWHDMHAHARLATDLS